MMVVDEADQGVIIVDYPDRSSSLSSSERSESANSSEIGQSRSSSSSIERGKAEDGSRVI